MKGINASLITGAMIDMRSSAEPRQHQQNDDHGTCIPDADVPYQ